MNLLLWFPAASATAIALLFAGRGLAFFLHRDCHTCATDPYAGAHLPTPGSNR